MGFGRPKIPLIPNRPPSASLGTGCAPYRGTPRRRGSTQVGYALGGRARYAPDSATFPNGTHVCEVEIDPETGETAILRYLAVDDVGTVIDPLGAKGAGEAGTVGALPAAMCAVADALATEEAADLDMPATPERIWRAMKGRTAGTLR